MKDYARIYTKIREATWLITPEALSAILEMVDERVKHGNLSDEEIRIRLQSTTPFHSDREAAPNGNGIGILPIEGPIFGKANMMTELSGATSLETFITNLRAMVADDSISSIILDIDSPGGTEELVRETAEEIRQAKEIKPVYAISNSMSGSAAYWLMSQAGSLYATSSGFVGSIGAYTVHEDKSARDAQEGRRFTYISAGPHKTEGNPHEPLSAEAREYRQEVINDLYEEFVNEVAQGRGVTTKQVEDSYGGGRMLPAKKALEAGMVDGITTFEGLVNHIVNQPRKTRIIVPGHVAKAMATQVAAMAVNDTPAESYYLDSFVAVYDNGRLRLESKEWEHSEPGTGSPPEPRTDEDGSDDPAIKGGWRKDTDRPVPLEEMEGYVRSERGEIELAAESERNALAEIRELFELADNSEDEAVVTAVRTMHNEWDSLRAEVNAASEHSELAEKYPSFWAEHQKNVEKSRHTDAKDFVESVSTLMHPEGESLKASKTGLSALATETLLEAHKRFASGQGALSDFENSIKAIMHGGTVEYGENGSSQIKDVPVMDLNSATGIANARHLFAEKIAEVQAEADKPWSGDFTKSVNETAKRYPDLARAYRIAIPA